MLQAEFIAVFQVKLAAKVAEFFSEHDARGYFHYRNCCSLAYERYGAAGSRVDFNDIDAVVLHCVLHIHQADHLEVFRHDAGVLLHGGNNFRADVAVGENGG